MDKTAWANWVIAALVVRVPAVNLFYINALFSTGWADDCPFTRAKFRQAVLSVAVARAINERLWQEFGARSQVQAIRDGIITWIRFIEKAGEGE